MRFNKTILVTFLFLFSVFVLSAQNQESEEDEIHVRIGKIDSSNYPHLKVYVSVENKTGEPNLSMVKGNFSVKVDTQDPVESVNVDPFKYLEEPVHYVFILSASGLMDGSPLASQKEALLGFSDQMRDGDTLSAYLVGDKLNELFFYAPADAIPEDAVLGVEVNDNPMKIYDSVVSIARKIEQYKKEELMPSEDRVVFILLSDGRDQESRYTMEQTLEVLTNTGIPIYSVGIRTLSSASLSMLNDLSNQSGGYYRYARTTNSIEENVQALTNQVLTAYVMQFRVKGVPADDSFHQLMVQVDIKTQSTQAFRNFLALKTPFPLWLKIVILAGTVLLILLIIFLMILSRIKLRKSLGITKRRCPECKRRMKDDWEFCPFCRYLPSPKRRKKKKGEES